jgi:hypothetical protein
MSVDWQRFSKIEVLAERDFSSNGSTVYQAVVQFTSDLEVECSSWPTTQQEIAASPFALA